MQHVSQIAERYLQYAPAAVLAMRPTKMQNTLFSSLAPRTISVVLVVLSPYPDRDGQAESASFIG